MTDLHAAPDLTPGDLDTAPTGLRRFRGATLDEALAAARLNLGDGLEIVEANRIRRGGLGGFFATDLGIEVIVAGPNSTSTSHELRTSHDVPAAVDRLLGRLDMQGGDRFVPSEIDTGQFATSPVIPAATIDAAARDPHPFATQLARELYSNGFTESDQHEDVAESSPELDPPTAEASTGESESGNTGAAARPAAPEPVEAASSDDALADIDQLLLRAGVILPADTATVEPSETMGELRPETTSTAASVAIALPTSELLTATLDRLVEQLAAVEPQVNGRKQTLHKLKVKINSPDGGSVEMMAEWSGDE